MIISIYLMLSPENIKYLFSLMGRESNSLSGREIAWSALLEQIKETPYFGIGYRISTEAVLEGKLEIDVSNSHNLYLSILSEVGVLGFLLFAYIYILLVISRNSAVSKSFMAIYICILFSFLLNHFFVYIFLSLGYFFIC